MISNGEQISSTIAEIPAAENSIRIADRKAVRDRLFSLLKECEASGKGIDPFFVAYLESAIDRLEELVG